MTRTRRRTSKRYTVYLWVTPLSVDAEVVAAQVEATSALRAACTVLRERGYTAAYDAWVFPTDDRDPEPDSTFRWLDQQSCAAIWCGKAG